MPASTDQVLHCPRCGYDLRGQTVHRCPECGLMYEPRYVALFWSRAGEGYAVRCIHAIQVLGLGVALLLAAGLRLPPGHAMLILVLVPFLATMFWHKPERLLLVFFRPPRQDSLLAWTLDYGYPAFALMAAYMVACFLSLLLPPVLIAAGVVALGGGMIWSAETFHTALRREDALDALPRHKLAVLERARRFAWALVGVNSLGFILVLILAV